MDVVEVGGNLVLLALPHTPHIRANAQAHIRTHARTSHRHEGFE